MTGVKLLHTNFKFIAIFFLTEHRCEKTLLCMLKTVKCAQVLVKISHAAFNLKPVAWKPQDVHNEVEPEGQHSTTEDRRLLCSVYS